MSKLFDGLDDYAKNVQDKKELKDQQVESAKEKNEEFKQEFDLFIKNVFTPAINAIKEDFSKSQRSVRFQINESPASTSLKDYHHGYGNQKYDVSVGSNPVCLRIEFVGNETHKKLFVYKQYVNKFDNNPTNLSIPQVTGVFGASKALDGMIDKPVKELDIDFVNEQIFAGLKPLLK
ncbi:MAG: hypothetical protein JWN76_716 [Chitinophagaceae bacterium]|nr:hypothetical protein [Chitinophagaceae bacterium]